RGGRAPPASGRRRACAAAEFHPVLDRALAPLGHSALDQFAWLLRYARPTRCAAERQALCATDEVRCGAPSVMRKRAEAPDRIDASHCLAAREHSTGDCAERRTALRALH